jgi:hypothetical protein
VLVLVVVGVLLTSRRTRRFGNCRRTWPTPGRSWSAWPCGRSFCSGFVLELTPAAALRVLPLGVCFWQQGYARAYVYLSGCVFARACRVCQ